MTILTSRSFAAIQALYDLLAAQSYPAATDNGEPAPQVWLGDVPPHAPREHIVIVGRVDDQSAEWATYGKAMRDERMLLLVRYGCYSPGRDGQAVLDRMEDICDVIQHALRDDTTGQPAALGYAGEVLTLGVVRVDPQIQVDTEGWVGRTDLFVSTQARI